MNKKISIVIPSYNSARLISKCISSLLLQKTKYKYEIIVVDSSKDNTPELIKSNYPEVEIIHKKRKTMPGEARNIGVKRANGEIIAFIDSDCVAHSNWIDMSIKVINSGYSFAGGSVANANPGIISTADYIQTFSEFLPGMPKKEIKFMPSCNFICKKKAFEKMGGFPKDLAVGEDTVFSYNVQKKYKMLFDPKLKVYHNNRTNLSDFIRHHINFGKASAKIRKQINLPGSILAKFPLLALLVPFVRFIRIFRRIIQFNLDILPKSILSFPIIFFGIMVWSFGFIKSAYEK
ncbi:MAG: glycosyltransferase [Nanoarchaeota archaeon]